MKRTTRAHKKPKNTAKAVKAESIFSVDSIYPEAEGSYALDVGIFGRFVAAILLFVLLMQPFATVLAAEDDQTSVENSSPKTAETPTPVELSPSEEPFVIAQKPEDNGETSDVSGENIPQIAAAEEGSAPLPESPTSDVPENVEIVSDLATSSADSDEAPDAVTASSTDANAQDSTQDTEQETLGTTTVATTTEIVADEEAIVTEEEGEATTSEDTATSTDVTVEIPPVNIEINDGNRYQFGVDDCVTVDGGFFYCSKKEEATSTDAVRQGVYAAQDQDGDLEIYVSKDGATTKITDNDYDDNAPQYDPVSDAIVWHALVDDRYQVMRYDFDSGLITQLTNTAYNNMEPSIEGDVVVWQAWIENNWEIMLDENGKRSRLSENEGHDIDPYVRGDLVSWQSDRGGEWDIKVYDRKTGRIDTIKAEGGTSAKNPRYLLVYDSVGQNGDVATVGYDLEEGISVPLASSPAPLPREIPKPVHEKDKRAFVQSSPNIKEEHDKDGEGGATSTPPIVPPSADNEDPLIVGTPGTDIPATPATTTLESPVVTDAPALAPLDLRAPAADAVDPAVSHIPDLVIPKATTTAFEPEA